MATTNNTNIVGAFTYDPVTGASMVNTGSGYTTIGGHTHTIAPTTYTAASGWKTTIDADDVYLKGKSLSDTLQKINDRLAIITNPDPKKLEKYAALKEAYDHYKMIEMLINEEDERKN